MYTFNNKALCFNNMCFSGIAGYTPIPPTPVVTTYSGFTYETTGRYAFTIDPAGGVLKYLTATYVQISGGDWSAVYTSNPVGLSDCLGVYAPSAGTYSLIWNNWQSYSSTTGLSYQGNNRDSIGPITKILSLDLWGKRNADTLEQVFHWQDEKADYSTVLPQPITNIPTNSANIHNGEALTSCKNWFSGCTTITSNLVTFIEAMTAACPNLTDTTGCLRGCVNGKNYSIAVDMYPDFF